MKRYLMTGMLLAVLGGCGSAPEQPPQAAMASPAPALLVERFLQAANGNDLATMTSLFGTPERTIDQLEGKQRAEERMYLLASILRHDDFAIEGQRVVPGQMNTATELLVRLRKGREETNPVPFRVVRRESGGWIIESIAVQVITGGR